MSKFTDRIDMRFAYTPASKTDIRKTIARERKRLADETAQTNAAQAEASVKVRALKRTTQAAR